MTSVFPYHYSQLSPILLRIHNHSELFSLNVILCLITSFVKINLEGALLRIDFK